MGRPSCSAHGPPALRCGVFVPALSLLVGSAGCTDYEISSTPKPVEAGSLCTAFEPTAYVPELTPACEQTPEIGPFDPQVEWQWTANPFHEELDRVETPPIVFDITGDGVPDLVFTAFEGGDYSGSGALVAVSGADRSTLFSVLSVEGHDVWGVSGVAVARIDGEPAIFVGVSGGLARVDAAGQPVWFAPTPSASGGWAAPALGDLEGDGVVDVVFGGTVVDQEGGVRWSRPEDDGRRYAGSFPIDLDRDGFQEVVTGAGILDRHGDPWWTDNRYATGWPAVGDMDGDGGAELIVGRRDRLALLDLGGNLQWEVEFPENGGGPPTVADFDGDGEAEIGIACKAFYRVFDGDGTMLWEHPTLEQSSGVTGSSVFDFEGDGAAEVVYADEGALWVFDGASGAVELEWDLHNSGTRFEYPTIADLDADGSAEVIVAHGRSAHGSSLHGLSVIGSITDKWAPARPIWNQYAYHVTNIDDSGAVPRSPSIDWDRWNTFRAAISETRIGLALPDLAVGTPENCTCNVDRSEIFVPVENRGLAHADELLLTLEALHGRFRFEVQTLEVEDIAPGEVAWVGPIEVHRSDFGPDGLVITAVPRTTFGPEAATDCDETNNAWHLVEFPCDGEGATGR